VIEGDAIGAAAGALLLLSARLLPGVLILPAPRPLALRLALGLGLATALLPLLPPTPSPTPAAVAVELLVGATFAFAAVVPLWAFVWAGRILDGPAHLDGPFARLHQALVLALYVGLGGHRLLARAFFAALGEAPLGGAASGGPEALVAALGQAFSLALAFTTPALLALLLVDLGRAFAARVAPGLGPGPSPARALVALATGLVATVGAARALPDLVGSGP
jgi:flagellar biosynthesis protein FliR